MPEAYIVDAVRTAGGRKGGALKDWHPADMAAQVLNALVDRTGDRSRRDRRRHHGLRRPGRRAGLPCRPQRRARQPAAGERARRHHRPPVRLLAAGDPVRRPGGDERHPGRGHRRRRRSMTRVPMGLPVTLAMQAGIGTGPFPKSIQERFGVAMFSQFIGAEMIAEKYQFRREELDAFALESHRKAARATEAGAFADEIVALEVTGEDGSTRLPRPRRGHTLRRDPRGHRRGQAAQGGRQDQRRQCQPDLRRRQRRAGGQRGGAEGARPDPARAHPQSHRHRRRSGDHARGADPGDPPGARARRHDDRRHRPLRGQRGVRAGAARLARARSAPIPTGSTSMAARSRSATRSAPRAPS